MTHLILLSPTTPDPTMLIIIGAVLAGAVLGGLLLALDVLGLNRVRLRRHGRIKPMSGASAATSYQWTATRDQAAVPEPGPVREVVGGRA